MNGSTDGWTGLLDVFSFFLYSKLVLYPKARIFCGQKVNINLKSYLNVINIFTRQTDGGTGQIDFSSI